MQIVINIEKKHLMIFSVLLVLVMAGFGVAGSWSPGDPFHSTLFTDTISSKSSDTVEISNNLNVQGKVTASSLFIGDDDVEYLISKSNNVGYKAVYASGSASFDARKSSNKADQITIGSSVTCGTNSYLVGIKVDVDTTGQNHAYLVGTCKKIKLEQTISNLNEGQSCNKDNQCRLDLKCISNKCKTPECVNDEECDGKVCDNYECVSKSSCKDSTDCKSNEICASLYDAEGMGRVCFNPTKDGSKSPIYKCEKSEEVDENFEYLTTYSCSNGEKTFTGGDAQNGECYCVSNYY